MSQTKILSQQYFSMIVAKAGQSLSLGSKAFNTSLGAWGSASESMIHDGLDGKSADLGKALTSAVSSVPGIGNTSSLKMAVGDSITDKLKADGMNEAGAQMTSEAVKAVGDSAVKHVQNIVTQNPCKDPDGNCN